MKYVLAVGKRRFSIENVRRFGRDDLSRESAMNRTHFEISVIQGSLFLRDLHSSSGTYLDGEPVTPGHLTPIAPGSIVRVGRTEMIIERHKAFALPRSAWLTAGSVFALFSFSTVKYSGAADAGAVSAAGLAILLGLLLLSVLASLTLSVLLFGRGPYSTGLLVFCFGFTFLVTGLVDTGLILAAESQWRISETWRTAKIERECLTKFEPSACARQLHACPSCVKRLKWGEREEIKFNLEPYRPHPKLAGEAH